MKPSHSVLADAVGVELDLQQSTGESERIITLGYQCAGWNFLVCNGVMAEVLPLPKINSVPKSPSFCWGICNIRGNITPVFDLSEKLTGASEFKARDDFYILLQGAGSHQVGIALNKIPQSIHFEPQQIMAQVSHLPNSLTDSIKNVYRQDEETWHELDVENLLMAI